MKRLIRTAFIVFGVLVIGAGCSADTKELDANVASKESKEADTEEAESSEEEVTEEELSTANEVIADNDNFKITFKRAVHTKDEYLGEEVRFIFEFENKSDSSLSLMSANDASVDGVMVDDLAGFSNPDVAGGKTGTVTLDFNSQWLDDAIDQEFPKFEENMEITLEVYNEDFETIGEFPFTVEF